MDCSREGCSWSASCYQTVGHGLSADGLSRAQMPVMWDGQDPLGMQRLRAEEGAPAAWGWRECRGWRTVSPYPHDDTTHSHTRAPPNTCMLLPSHSQTGTSIHTAHRHKYFPINTLPAHIPAHMSTHTFTIHHARHVCTERRARCP